MQQKSNRKSLLVILRSCSYLIGGRRWQHWLLSCSSGEYLSPPIIKSSNLPTDYRGSWQELAKSPMWIMVTWKLTTRTQHNHLEIPWVVWPSVSCKSCKQSYYLQRFLQLPYQIATQWPCKEGSNHKINHDPVTIPITPCHAILSLCSFTTMVAKPG